MDEHEEKYWKDWEEQAINFCKANNINIDKFKDQWHDLNRIDGTPQNYEEVKKACFDMYVSGYYNAKKEDEEIVESRGKSLTPLIHKEKLHSEDWNDLCAQQAEDWWILGALKHKKNPKLI